MRNFFNRVFFNLWYFRQPPWDTGISPPELLAYIDSRSPGRALDLGCGTGTNAITLAKRGWEATGVDFALRAIQVARRKAKEAGVKVRFLTGDAAHLEGVTGPFDLILDMGCLHSLTEEDAQDYIGQVESLLSPGGAFLLYAFLPGPDGGRGLSQAAIDRMDERLDLVSRKNGTERGTHPSAWFHYTTKGDST